MTTIIPTNDTERTIQRALLELYMRWHNGRTDGTMVSYYADGEQPSTDGIYPVHYTEPQAEFDMATMLDQPLHTGTAQLVTDGLSIYVEIKCGAVNVWQCL